MVVRIGEKMYLQLGKVIIYIQCVQSFVIFDCWTENDGSDYFIKFLKMEVVVSILRTQK
jgi:hypothetical protein